MVYLPLAWHDFIRDANQRRRDQDQFRVPRALQPTSSGVKVTVAGAGKERRAMTLFSTNDYMGLAAHPSVRAAIAAAAQRFGCGPRAAAIVAGHSTVHDQLEREIAELKSAQAALLFPTGFAANSACIAALASGADAVIFADALNHACLIDGCRLAARAGARLHVYRHRDTSHLAELLAACDAGARQLVVTDGVFSMDGTVADLQGIAQLKRRFGFLLLVDDAHGTLVLGTRGGGSGEASGVCSAIDVHTGTLSKALGAQGGFVACGAALKAFLVNHARSYVYSTALPVPVAAGALQALQTFRREGWRRQHLCQLMGIVRDELGCDAQSAIVPIIVGCERRALALSEALWTRGFHVPAIRPPTVPAGTSRLRISLSAEHSMDDVRQMAATLAALLREDAKVLSKL